MPSTREGGDDLLELGKAAHLLLGEDEAAVRDDVELALLPADCGRVDPPGSELGRETRGPGVVAASDRAVEDLDVHREDTTLRQAPAGERARVPH